MEVDVQPCQRHLTREVLSVFVRTHSLENSVRRQPHSVMMVSIYGISTLYVICLM